MVGINLTYILKDHSALQEGKKKKEAGRSILVLLQRVMMVAGPRVGGRGDRAKRTGWTPVSVT